MGKTANFAHSDAEAPPSVFLFHRFLIFRGGKGRKTPFRLNFCYAKIRIILLIYNIFGLINDKKKHSFCPSGSLMEKVLEFAGSVPEFRRTGKGNIRHRLSDVIVLMILARTAGHAGRQEIIEFGRHNIAKFRAMGLLRRGVPSEPTLCRIEQGLDCAGLARGMAEMMASFRREAAHAGGGPDIVCIDGKAMRGTVQGNGRNPDIVSAYSARLGITLDTEMCREKSNEMTAVPELLGRLDIAGSIVTADAMSMQKAIIDKIRERHGDFVIEVKANQRALRYGIEDRLKTQKPTHVHEDGPALAHGRIESRSYRAYDGLPLIADREKWGGRLTVAVFDSVTVRKSTGVRTAERRLYLSSLPPDAALLGQAVRRHWAIESMHWNLDRNFKQDRIKRKTARAARNLDTIQRVVHALFAMWRMRRKKRSDKAKGNAELMRDVSMSFTHLVRFLSQK